MDLKDIGAIYIRRRFAVVPLATQLGHAQDLGA
jgi:hypothetical protein